MIQNTHKNCMGTLSFDGKFEGMRKAQDFIVYPLKSEADGSKIVIQSNTRIGQINLNTGEVRLSKSHSSGAYFAHLMMPHELQFSKLSAEDLLILKSQVFATAHGQAGTNGIVYTDNSGALGAFSGN